MDLPVFRRGLELVSQQLNKLSEGIRAATITSVIGGTFTRTPGGTTLTINVAPSGGGGAAVVADCNFRLSDATDESGMRIAIESGTAGNRMPNGMDPDNPTIYETVTESCYVYVVQQFDAVSNQVLPNPEAVYVELSASPQTNTKLLTYTMIGTVSVEDGAIKNVWSWCQHFSPNPCDLDWSV